MHLIAYVRVSTDEQVAKFGPAMQRADIAKWADIHGHTIAHVIHDDGVSGLAPLDERPGLLRAVAWCRRDALDGIVVWRRDRLTRDPVETAIVEQMLAKGDARVYSVDGSNDDGPESAMARSFGDIIARYEAAKIRARTMGGKRQAVDAGHTWAAAPYGYREASPGLLQVEEEQARVVRRILAAREKGCTYQAISDALNSDAVPPPSVSAHARRGRGRVWSSRWTLFGVRRVCDRVRFYMGEVNQLGEQLGDKPGHTPLIREEE